MNTPCIFRLLSACLLLALAAPLHAQDGPKQPIPDLLKGEELTRKNERWAGPIGVHFGYWRPRQRSNEQPWVRQLLVQKIEEGSPADGVLEVGDVILGADGTGAKQVPMFKGSHNTLIPIADAITEAEARKPAVLKLLVWRKGKTSTVSIQLEYLGRYSDTAPYNCPKSRNVLRKGIARLAREEKCDKAGFGILCLLAANDPTNPDNAKHQALAKKWAHELELEGGPWHSGPQLMALAEYYMMTKDQSIFPKLVAKAEQHAKGVSWFGTTGHRYCEPHPDGSGNGMIGGYGPINCSGALGFLGLSLAREAGVKSEVVEKSHKAQRIFFGHYAFKGGLPYGEHAYGLADGLGDYNGKCAMSALAFSLEEGEEKKVKFFAGKSALSSDGVRGYAHGGPFFGQVFHPLGANLIGPKTANLQFREIQWHLDLKRRWDHTRIFDARSNNYADFSYWATAMLHYATPLKQLIITGRDRKPSLELNSTEFRELVMAKEFDPKLGTSEQLVAAIPSCQGFLRSSIAKELSSRIKAKPDAPESAALIDKLVATVLDEQAPLLSRVGSCAVLMETLKGFPEPLKSAKSESIAKAMVTLLQHEAAYIRFAAVRVLENLDPAVLRPHLNAVMEAIVAIERPTFPLNEEDPLQWSHGIMSKMLVDNLLKTGLDDVDRSKLIPAVRSMLRTPSGHSRTSSTKILSKLNKEETLAVSDMLIDNIEQPPPADSMFGRGAGPNAQAALAKHKFEEILPLSMALQPAAAIKSKIPQTYGKAALQTRSPRELIRKVGELLIIDTVDVQSLFGAITEGEAPEELPKLKRIDSAHAADDAVKLPAHQTKLMVEATNFAVRTKDGTTYTWRKLYGPGKVRFEPNASGTSNATTVTFVEKKPGKYMFEVEMSDSLGISVVRETVGVGLYDGSGKLPANRPPQAKSQVLDAVPGQPLAVNLSAADPDGDDLGYVVTELPKHGKLTDAVGRIVEEMAALEMPLTYIADYGRDGSDQLSFLAMDGQGKTSKGTLGFRISSKDVSVAVYEGFNYPAGPLLNREGGGSFGFSEPWKVTKDSEGYNIERGKSRPNGAGESITYPGMPATGGYLNGTRWRHASRALDRQVMDAHKLLDDGGELWFSIFVEAPRVSFELKGPEQSLGFGTEARDSKIFPTFGGKKAGTDHNPWSRSQDLRFAKTAPHMIVGHCSWSKTPGEPDTMKIYRVFNAPVYGPMLLETPVGVLSEVIDQKSIDSVVLNADTDVLMDELRIGPTLNSVMIGSVPMK